MPIHPQRRKIAGRVARYHGPSSIRLAARGARYQFTYRQLNAAANRIARAILDRRSTGEGPVGVLLDNDALAVAAILGILKAGKGYVPRHRCSGHPPEKPMSRDRTGWPGARWAREAARIFLPAKREFCRGA